MGEEISDAMNLDLNLGPAPEPIAGAIANEAMNLDDWVERPIHRISEAVRLRVRPQWRWPHELHNRSESLHHFRFTPEAQTVSMELNQFLVNSGNGSGLQAGEGSVAVEGRTEEGPKECKKTHGVTLDETSEKKEGVERGSGNDGCGFFDCNICLDFARDPVVTCCGHLFCWPCIYKWIDVHSDAKECPVCKGEVTTKNVTPIYGRRNNVRLCEEDSCIKIPMRPTARRVESLRQTIQRNVELPLEEMIRHLGRRGALTQDSAQLHELGNAQEIAERTSSLLSRFLTSRGMRREQNHGVLLDSAVGSTENNVGGAETEDNRPGAGDNRRIEFPLHRRMPSRRASFAARTSALNSAERLVEAYFHSNPIDRNQEQPPSVDDRDSFSSIGAVINSGSQVDTAAEIDSMVSLSTSSSRRRSEHSRVSDVDSGESRAPRRRRLNLN